MRFAKEILSEGKFEIKIQLVIGEESAFELFEFVPSLEFWNPRCDRSDA